MKDVVMFCEACTKNQATGMFCQDCGKALTSKDYLDLEAEFAKLVVKVRAEVLKANNLLMAAEEMSNELGVPFDKGSAVYIPESFYVKFASIRPRTVNSLVPGIYSYDIEDKITGWITSSSRC